MDENYEIFKKLRNYYEKNCAPLIFYGEQILENNKSCRMYFLDTTEKKELENYKKVFQEYLFLYVRNHDNLFNFDNLNEEYDELKISQALYANSKKVWDDESLVITSNPITLGIYGELFDEFYLNIVKKENILLTYSTKYSFNSRNIKGCDNIGIILENDNLTLILSECKFYADISGATKSLIEDIIGTDKEKSHITKEYINRYLNFVVDKQHSLFSSIEDNKKIISILEKINHDILNAQIDITPIDILNKYNVKIRFDFFSIYNDKYYTPKERKTYYQNIVKAFNEQIKDTGIINYSIEIIFIPTKNISTEIKRSMYTWN